MALLARHWPDAAVLMCEKRHQPLHTIDQTGGIGDPLVAARPSASRTAASISGA
jgi:hypothetical protein